MRIINNERVGFREVFTDKNPPPWYRSVPQKNPYIILELDALQANIDYLKSMKPKLMDLGLASSEDGDITLVITSQRKVIEAINYLLTSKRYDNPSNLDLFKQLREQLNELITVTKVQDPPKKSKERSRFEDKDRITHGNNVPISVHEAVRVQKKDSETIEVYKADPTGRSIIDIEAFSGMCYRVLLNDRTPKVRSVYENGKRVGIISRAIKNFSSLQQYYAQNNYKSPSQQRLVEAGIGAVLAAPYCEEENDLHGGNIHYDEKLQLCMKIDHDQSLWPLTAKYKGMDPNKLNNREPKARNYRIKPIDAFPITQRDITKFPHLEDAKPRSFPDRADGGILNLKGIQKDKKFIKDAYMVFLKKALLGEQIYRNFAEATIRNEKLREKLIQHQTQRSKLLRAELEKNPKFRRFMNENLNLKEELLNEFRKYNEDFKEGSSLRVDIDELSRQFDEMKSSCDSSNPKPREEALKGVAVVEAANTASAELIAAVKAMFKNKFRPGYEHLYFYKEAYPSPMFRTALITEIATSHGVDKDTVERQINYELDEWRADNIPKTISEQSAQTILEAIYDDILKLDKKIGRLGGETRDIPNGKIKIPKGAAAIFDLYSEYTVQGNSTAEATLKKVMNQARYSLNRTNHGFFNRRHIDTTVFYQNIVGIKIPEPENDPAPEITTSKFSTVGIHSS